MNKLFASQSCRSLILAMMVAPASGLVVEAKSVELAVVVAPSVETPTTIAPPLPAMNTSVSAESSLSVSVSHKNELESPTFAESLLAIITLRATALARVWRLAGHLRAIRRDRRIRYLRL